MTGALKSAQEVMRMVTLLRYEQVAERLGLKESTVRRLAATGVLPKIHPTPAGRAVRIPSDAVDALIRRGRDPQGERGA